VLTLVMNPGLPEEQSFALPVGSITIGRTKDNDVFCLHKSLSRKHAQVDFDGSRVRVADLQSKNGIFHNGKRVQRCELHEGDSFRCGDITFLLEGATTRSPKISVAAQTLPSPLALDASASRRPTKVPTPHVVMEDDQRYKDKLFLLIRASELLVSEMGIDKILDELVVLAVQVLEVDRICLLTLDEDTLDMKPRVLKTFTSIAQRPYSKRVVDWVVDHGSPASFADVSRDKSLPGGLDEDPNVRAAMCVPINPGGGTIGVLYADSLTQAESFRPDDLALLRALANFAAVAIEGESMHRADRQSMVTAPRSRS
jgi:adenylate cyclase